MNRLTDVYRIVDRIAAGQRFVFRISSRWAVRRARLLFRISLIISALMSQFLVQPASHLLAQDQPDMTIRVPYQGRVYLGKPLVWDGSELMLLRPNGNISILPVKSEADYQKVRDGFEPYSSSQMRAKLQREFGSDYQVSTTRHFLVVHPVGDFSVWAAPFEELYIRFNHFFESRGLSLSEPEFPMVAVVLKTRGEFDRFLRAYHEYDRKILGYYSPRSNRIITYDQSNGRQRDTSWLFNTDTIVHEASHQTAFNTGLHSRYSPVARWVTEGLAMLFEAPGINNSAYHSRQSDRINRARLIALKQFYRDGRVAKKLREMIQSDRLFRSEPDLAYALAWGMSFYLSEKMPREYLGYLANDGQREPFLSYSAKERAADFAKAFGGDLQHLEARMQRFFESLQIPEAKVVQR